MLTTRLSYAAPQGAVLFALMAGCGAQDSNDTTPTFETDPKLLKAALESPIVSCQDTHRECRGTAEDDADARGVCNDELATCLQAAADQAQETARALTQCRDEARACVRDGGDADDCRSTYETCSEAVVNGGDTDQDDDADAGSDEDVDVSLDGGVTDPSDDTDDNDSEPSLPGPTLDGGPLDGLPKPVQCIIELRLCVSLDFSAGAGGCADEARICLGSP